MVWDHVYDINGSSKQDGEGRYPRYWTSSIYITVHEDDEYHLYLDGSELNGTIVIRLPIL